MTARTDLGHWLRRRRQLLGLTQEALAELASCSPSLIRKLETGERPLKRDVAEHLASALRIPPAQRALFLQVALAGQPFAVDHPPWEQQPSARTRFPGRLPAPPTPLLGRNADVAMVAERLRDPATRLLTLLGPPGVGKTRLGIAVAADLEPFFRDGVCFVELAPIHDPALVPAALAGALGLQEAAGTTLLDTIAAFLADRALLLLLDNFEHLLEARFFVAELLKNCPQLHILTTSRAPLQLRAERRVVVAPLAEVDAVALFIDRVQAVNQAIAADIETHAIAAAICDRLDRLPLAIELAAVRADTLSLSRLLAQIAQPLAALTDAPFDMPQHQRTLRDTIDWSYRQLSSAEQAIFRHCAVMRGGGTAEAIADIAGVTPQVAAALLGRLAENQLLLRVQGHDGARRYVMLESLREYGIEQLVSSGEEADARRRHAIHFLALAEQAEIEIHRADQQTWINRISTELNNIREALDWALERDEVDLALRLSSSLHMYWYVRGSVPEGARWMEAAIARARALQQRGGAVEARWLAKGLQYAGYMEFSGYARLTRARALYEESLALHEQLDDPQLRGAALNGLGLVARMQGRIAEARELHQQARRFFEQAGFAHGIVRTRTNLALVALASGDLEEAATTLRACIAEYRALGDQERAATNLALLAEALEAMERFDEAAATYQEGIVTQQILGSERGQAECTLRLGRIHLRQGRVQLGSRLMAEALRFYLERLGAVGAINIVEAIALAHHAAGHAQTAVRLLSIAHTAHNNTRREQLHGHQQEVPRTIERLRTTLGERRFDEIWRQGAAETLEDAIALLHANP
jgi:predicted ATPase/transcriptional regulator with XRE-family HTH domain